MYLRGLGYSDDEFNIYTEWETPVVVSAPPVSTPTAAGGDTGFNIDWGGMVGNALRTWGQVETAKIQAEPQLLYAQRGINPAYYQSPGGPYGVYPGVSPFQTGAFGPPGTLFGLPMSWVIIGGALIAAALVMTGGKK